MKAAKSHPHMVFCFCLLLAVCSQGAHSYAGPSVGHKRSLPGRRAKQNLKSPVGPLVADSPVEQRSVNELYRHLTYRQILDQEPPSAESHAAAYGAERKELSDQLTTLRANGYDVKQATGQFFAIDDLLRTRRYDQLPAALSRTRQCIADTASSAQNISVASSRTKNWQR